MGWTLSQLLRLLHPFMPFITEELWAHLGGAQNAETGQVETGQGRLITAPWPSYGDELIDPDAAAEIDWVIRLISEVRAVRAEMNVPAGAKILLLLRDANATNQARLDRHRDLVTRLARLSGLETLEGGEVPKGAVQIVLDEATAVLPLAAVIDVSKELERLKREMTKADSEIAKFDKKLANAQFLSKAPTAVVEEQKERRAESAQLRDKLAAALGRLAG